MVNAIWDFDGTLFDTYPYMITAFCKALEECGIDGIELDPDDYYDEMRTYSLGSAKDKYAAKFRIDRDELSKRYRKIEKDEVMLSKPFAGVDKTLQTVIDSGGQNGLLTHRDDRAIKLLKKYKLKKLFTGFVTSKQPFERKPNPESLNYLIDEMNLNRGITYMVGDRKIDVQAGKNAGIKTILFDPDYQIKDDGDPDYLFHSFSEIEDFFKN